MMNHMIDLNNTTDWSDTRALVASCGPLAASSDSWLIQHFAVKRDERAFAVLLLRHGPMVLNVCRRILGDHHAAEDALQATFLVLARKARSLKNPEQLANWLYGVARRVALDSRARGRRWRLRQDVPLDLASPSAKFDPCVRELSIAESVSHVPGASWVRELVAMILLACGIAWGAHWLLHPPQPECPPIPSVVNSDGPRSSPMP
jgi:hypothetical protein